MDCTESQESQQTLSPGQVIWESRPKEATERWSFGLEPHRRKLIVVPERQGGSLGRIADGNERMETLGVPMEGGAATCATADQHRGVLEQFLTEVTEGPEVDGRSGMRDYVGKRIWSD